MRRCRRSLIPFTTRTYNDYLAGHIHQDIGRELVRFSQDVTDQKSPRLIITLPPRAGKTFLAAERFPIWHLGKNPRHEIIVAGHNADLARKSSRAARNLLLEERTQEVFPDLRLAKDSRSLAEWSTDQDGKYQAVGTSGSPIGRGAHVLILDDLLPGFKAALSRTQRDDIWTWYDTSAYTRLAPGGGVLVIATRWHEDDLIGRLIREGKAGGDQFRIIHAPAIAMVDEEHRLKGEALHPDRWSLEYLERIKRKLPPMWWNALYQGCPAIEGGVVWEEAWFQRYDSSTAPTSLDAIWHSWDCSFGSLEGDASWVVGQIWGIRGDDHYLLHQVRERMKMPDMVRAVTKMLEHPVWGDSNRRFGGSLIEAKANGMAIIHTLEEYTRATLIGFDPGKHGSKIARAHASAPAISNRTVWIPDEGATDWVDEYVRECTEFPAGSNDDQVDATTQFLLHVAPKSSLGGGLPHYSFM